MHYPVVEVMNDVSNIIYVHVCLHIRRYTIHNETMCSAPRSKRGYPLITSPKFRGFFTLPPFFRGCHTPVTPSCDVTSSAIINLELILCKKKKLSSKVRYSLL